MTYPASSPSELSQTRLSRRQFHATVCAGLTGVAAGSLIGNESELHAATAQPESTKLDEGWIDAHVHVWTPDVQSYPLDAGFTVESMQPPSFTPQQLFAQARPSGVTRIVLIQMSFYRFDNSYMLDVIKAYPGLFSGVGIVDPQAPNVAEQMKSLAKQGVRGFRLHALTEKWSDWVDDAGMATVWKTAQAENLAVCPLINPQDLTHVETLCRKYPDVKVVIDHFARIGVSGTIEQDYLKQLCRLAKFRNAYVKTSAFYALGKKQVPYTDLLPMIRQVADAYTPQRLMWASDCPYQVQGDHDYESSIALIRDRADFLTQAEKTVILRGTAQEVFFG